MIYLRNFRLLSEEEEYEKILLYKMNIYNNFYPLRIFPQKELRKIEFEPITIFYGGNGSGKTTLLNIIGDAVEAYKKNIEKRSELFSQYVYYCGFDFYHRQECKSIVYLSSDDVFDYLLDLRALNANINRRKEELVKEYSEYKKSSFYGYRSAIDQYEEIRNKVDSNRMTVSTYVKSRLDHNNILQESNGETALTFWKKNIKDHSLYIIDEPENSLSASNQLKLKNFIEESARFYHCQFIIATHSPFLLSLSYAKIYDLDDVPVRSKKWTELENIKIYEQFFREHRDEFKE